MAAPQDIRITFRPEWGTGPLWIALGDDISQAYDPDKVADILDLSVELRAAINEWDDLFQATLDHDYPPDSAFPTPEDEAAFIATGKQLALRLRSEAPHATVTYKTLVGTVIPLD